LWSVKVLGASKQVRTTIKPPGMALLFTLLLCVVLTSITAYATSPFSEVPRDHWSYNALDRLFAAGLVNDPVGRELFELGYRVSRYEMAVWTAAALDTMSHYPLVEGNKTLVLNSIMGRRLVQVGKLAAQHNQLYPDRPLSEEDIQLLDRLVGFLADQLSEFGYYVPYADSAWAAAADLTATNANTTQTAFSVGGGVFTLGPTVDLGSVHQNASDIWRASSYTGGDTSTVPVGLGFSLQLGGLLFSAEKGLIAGENGNTETTALGLRYSVSNMGFQVGYASEVGYSSQDLTGRHLATASFEYEIAPETLASAGLTVSNDQTQKSTDFGLRYRIQDASVSLGYRLVDYSKGQPVNHNSTYDNVATAEFSISF
jgi:hypothetical protein